MNTFRKDGHSRLEHEDFRLPGRERALDVRTEFIHFSNTPQFDRPGVQLALATSGRSPTPSNKGRQVQFTLKLDFKAVCLP